ncbi:TetR/AcrR family transcriptional regulator [Mycolicibacterium holsaticum]|uniref:TetR family transcriptional regulator n=1 Tax=Mycolicibacterium holsaticum TaxID=152142 RepID=A0A1E3RZT8_9MYCO|nr:TetR/AcrR family transcriptional regulator [Mycolicibacterium holsaticum]MDA4109976.1 TetR family transcriptional regulator [Mycolicibacterium holsaticum DSM 44478 = JCM 12374]ODQ95341.1 TetR family transcriptional regulator [Mycolicibacterium holsaticum]QZA12102.1 TetR/AcrR family transcriptional regulator [Mycolicibacterium holsaticum DSM 44478 = JCM 12374]UNC10412.1 TetR/AcrR family transcriptional regulator [Mycolicibacterium holsaticum DSM 44478 = JCM 12374]
MSPSGQARTDAVRRRPKDRKAQIAQASAEAFSALGYYGVSMEAIASRVGISAAALYRHYASKYELFRDAVLSLGQQLVDCTAFADGVELDDPPVLLDRLVAALIETAMRNRVSGGLYRWEGRYLRGDDQASLIAQMRIVNHRIQRPLNEIRPDLTSRQRWTLSIAVLSVIGSIVDHRAKLPAVQVRALLADLAHAVLTTDLPDVADADAAPRARIAADSSKYEALLTESMWLFNINGYRETSMEDIAAAVGMPASGIYRYFSGKSDILAAAFRRAADRLSAELATITSTIADREDALTAVIDAYVERSFDQPELDYVYYTERLNMTAADQKILRNMQRATVEAWVDLVVAVRPEWTPGQARFAVHAAMSLVIDLGRLTRYENSPQSHLMLQRLLDLTLLGRYRLRATLPAR